MIRHILPLLSNIYWWYNHDPHINITVMYQHAVCVKYNSDIKFHSTHSLYDSNNHDYDMGCRIVALGILSCLRVWTPLGLDNDVASWKKRGVGHGAYGTVAPYRVQHAPCIHTVRYRTVPYATVRYRTVPYGTVEHRTRHRTVPYAAGPQ
jgi:hypothetical protein